MTTWDYIENIVIVIATTVLVLGLYAMSESWYSLFGLLLLLWLNMRMRKK